MHVVTYSAVDEVHVDSKDVGSYRHHARVAGVNGNHFAAYPRIPHLQPIKRTRLQFKLAFKVLSVSAIP